MFILYPVSLGAPSLSQQRNGAGRASACNRPANALSQSTLTHDLPTPESGPCLRRPFEPARSKNWGSRKIQKSGTTILMAVPESNFRCPFDSYFQAPCSASFLKIPRPSIFPKEPVQKPLGITILFGLKILTSDRSAGQAAPHAHSKISELTPHRDSSQKCRPNEVSASVALIVGTIVSELPGANRFSSALMHVNTQSLLRVFRSQRALTCCQTRI